MPPDSTLGVDPGKTGAVAFLGPDGAVVADMPYLGDEVDVRALDGLLDGWGVPPGCTVALEYQAPFSAPGRRMGVTSAFDLGEGYGMLKGFCMTARLRLLLPRPAAWKKEFKLQRDKEESRLLAARLFPEVDLHLKKHHGRAEALLLAEWARRQP